MMMRNVNVVVCVLVVALVANLGACSLLPFMDRRDADAADINMLRDPFRILEHIPFGLDRDDVVVPPARVDWKETPTSHLIMLDVPGVKREELKIEVEENRIVRVSGERKREEEKKEDKWHRVERGYGRFWRQFRLPENADLDTVNAELKDGVLTITFNKIPSDKIKTPRVVSIIGGGEEGPKKVDHGRKTEF